MFLNISVSISSSAYMFFCSSAQYQHQHQHQHQHRHQHQLFLHFWTVFIFPTLCPTVPMKEEKNSLQYPPFKFLLLKIL